MISGNMIKPSYNDAIAAWEALGNEVKQISGFTSKKHKQTIMPTPKTRQRQEKLPPLSESNAEKLHHWLIAHNGRQVSLANYLGVSKTNVAMIRDRKTPCPPSKWRNIVKFMESCKV